MSTPFPRPSLPPNVDGEVIGTLAISFRRCSISEALARIQFWGETRFSDLCPEQQRRSSNDTVPLNCPEIGTGNDDRPESSSHEAGRSKVVYELVGNSLSLCKYLEDASPLQVSFSRHQKGTSSAQVAFLGCASITDIGNAELFMLEAAQNNVPEQMQTLSLRRVVQISSSGPDANSSNFIGQALFELVFQVRNPATAQQQKTASQTEQFIQHQSMAPNQRSTLSFKQNQAKKSLTCDDSTQSLIGEVVGLQSDTSTSNEAENQTLFEELLDLCTDDMTIPTTCSAITAFDPYDMWISRMVAHASSPPNKEFPSLVSSGSRNSSALQRIDLLEIEIYEVTLFSRVANRIKGKHDFFLQYDPPPHACVGSKLNSIDFTAREQFEVHARTKSATRTRHRNKGDIVDLSLLESNHTKCMKVVFEDDDSIRHWLEGMIEFRLFSCASKTVNHSKLPRVATLAGNRKGINPVSTFGRMCIAKACLRLRNIVLSDMLASDTKLDLTLTNDSIGKVGENIGSLSVRLGLHSSDKSMDQSCSDTRMDQSCSRNHTNSAGGSAEKRENIQFYIEKLPTSSSSTPHPIAVFLSNFAGASNKSSVLPQQNVPPSATSDTSEKQIRAVSTVSASCCPVEANQQGQSPQPDFVVNEEPTKEKILQSKGTTDLKPVTAPPIWLDIRIKSISNLRIDTVSDKSGSLQLSMSCNRQFLPVGKVKHLQSDCDGITSGITRSIPLGSETSSQEIAKLSSNRSDIFSMNTVCSWQVALEVEHDGDKAALLILYIYHCRSSGDEPSSNLEENTLVGSAKIPFVCKSTLDSQYKVCNWLPKIATSDWFDVTDTKSNHSIGSIQVTVATGRLKQIRGFGTTCKSISKVQEWWRNKRTNTEESIEVSGEKTTCTVDRDNPVRMRSPEDDPSYNAAHENLLGRTISKQTDDINDPASSPDSLFEEWSQQSLSATECQNRNSREHKNTIIIDTTANSPKMRKGDEVVGRDTAREKCGNEMIIGTPAAKCSQQNTFPFVSSKCSGRDDATGIDTTSTATQKEDLTAFNTTKSCRGVCREHSPCKNNAADQFEIRVLLEKMSGLPETLLMWQQGNSYKQRLLSVSGIFVSYSVMQESAVLSQQEELHKVCLGENVWHSKLVPADVIHRDIDLNLETTISIPNHEKNTDMILAQIIELKLWLVPVVTTTINAMINDSKEKNTQALNGCKVISIAECPLYHLYTAQGYYSGRVPWNVVTEKNINGANSDGCILISIHRANAQNDKEGNCNISVLKPSNLEGKFTTHCAKGIDPPEVIKQPCKAPSNKRKVETGSVGLREFKRYRCVENSEVTRVKPSHDVFNDDASSKESGTISPSQEDTAYHSLNSVLESLENIDTKLQQVSSFAKPQQKTVLCNDRNVSSHVDLCPEITTLGHKHTGRQMEPPGESLDSETPTDQTAKSNVGIHKTKTCEKGSSPMSVAYHCADATTSPCEESLVGTNEDSGKENENVAENKLSGEDCKYEKGKASKTINNLAGLPSQQAIQRLRQSIERRESSSKSQLQSIREHLRGISKNGDSLKTHSFSRDLLKKSTYQARQQILSPVLGSMCPAGHLILNGGRRPFSRLENSPIATEKEENGVLHDKDRLERIFLSNPTDQKQSPNTKLST